MFHVSAHVCMFWLCVFIFRVRVCVLDACACVRTPGSGALSGEFCVINSGEFPLRNLPLWSSPGRPARRGAGLRSVGRAHRPVKGRLRASLAFQEPLIV